MVHPDYESFQVPAEVQEEYRKLVLQKRIVKWADGNAYDAEAVDAAIEAGEISTQLTEKETKRLKQILWAKAEGNEVKYRFTSGWLPQNYSYDDDPIYEQAFRELAAYVIENGTYESQGSNGKYSIIFDDPVSVVTGLAELVSINGGSVLGAEVVVQTTDPETPGILRLHSYPDGEASDPFMRTGRSSHMYFITPDASNPMITIGSGLNYVESDSGTTHRELEYGDLGFTSMAEYEAFIEALFADENADISLGINSDYKQRTFYNADDDEVDIAQAAYCVASNNSGASIILPTAEFLPVMRQRLGSDTAVAIYRNTSSPNTG